MNTTVLRMYEVYQLHNGHAIARWGHKGSAIHQCKMSPNYRFRVLYIEVPIIDGHVQGHLAYDINWFKTGGGL
jgi:hypothetical protein